MFDSLAALVSEVLRQDPFSGHLFAFFNRKRDKLKLLVWERGGFWLLYKRPIPAPRYVESGGCGIELDLPRPGEHLS